ncbi:hypothetical protein FIV00_14970 [Labrenzia sp. THAF82]|uniref:hypothetical protein n=1 Tax=Labrenzia sp. THAF82 TaxID=2587861 RepID=UPI0012A8D455|nr:hypothetical protein [Labrenzia sp. THAF82]QFT31792.1 hypothetical protein FIV00_14970 [Labrenzia sp. THAF82]
MGKRSSRPRVDKDLYCTIDPRAVPPLIPFLRWERISSFIDPCWGWGHLVGPLARAGLTCLGRYDLEPKMTRKVDPDLPGVQGHVIQRDGRDLSFSDLNGADAIIANPPWTFAILKELICRWAKMAPTWLLFYGNWLFTERAAPLINGYLTDFVPVPRLQWIPGTDHAEKDSCGWYRFHFAEAQESQVPRFWPLGSSPFAGLPVAKPLGERNDNFRFQERVA